MAKDMKASGGGCISPGGDKYAYLGHFRSSENMKRGHNFGFPGFGGGGDKPERPKSLPPPTKKQLASPEWRAKNRGAAARADVRAAKKSGGDVAGAKAALKTVRGERKEAFKDIKTARQALRKAEAKPGGGAVKAAKAELKEAKGTAKTQFSRAYKTQKAERKYQRDLRESKGNGGMFGRMVGMAKKAHGG